MELALLCRYLEPIIRGDYPKIIRSIVGNRLPRFTKEQSLLLKGSLDFLGLNYYTTYYAQNGSPSNAQNLSFSTDAQVNTLCKSRKQKSNLQVLFSVELILKRSNSYILLADKRNGVLIGPQACSHQPFTTEFINQILSYALVLS